MSDPTALLKLRDLRLDGQGASGTTHILRGIDLDLAKGEVLGVIGESGAGKSSLGLAAMGFCRNGCRFAGGSANFDGNELIGARPAVLSGLRSTRIAYVAQSAAASFNPAWRLIDQYCEFPVLRGLMDRKAAEKDAIEIYEQLRLPNPKEIGFRYPHQVSGGQLQRAMTAMAMSCRPDLIIFDEPTTALDVTTQIEVLSAIRSAVNELGTAALYITHDLAVVAQMADRIMVMRHGEVVEEAATRTMLDAPREAYTKSLWAVRNIRPPAKPLPPTDTSPLMQISNVTAGYGSNDTALQDIGFDVHAGRTRAVVGESGSGKSTAARVIAGLLPPRSGEVRLDGQLLPPDYRKRSRDQLRKVQLIYQMADTALNPRQRIGDIIARPVSFYAGLRGRALRERVREILSDIELDPDTYMDRSPAELSGGQKQRVGIGRALAAEPQFIICDEVTSALDQIVAENILTLLQRVQRDYGLSYMFITHDLSTVRAIADDVTVMQRGKIVEQGTATHILECPQHEYTRKLLASVPEMDPDWLSKQVSGVDSIV